MLIIVVVVIVCCLPDRLNGDAEEVECPRLLTYMPICRMTDERQHLSLKKRRQQKQYCTTSKLQQIRQTDEQTASQPASLAPSSMKERFEFQYHAANVLHSLRLIVDGSYERV